ncbi:MAG: type I-D CRISPR-associated protein Cas7/Csc2 [Phormidium sp.]
MTNNQNSQLVEIRNKYAKYFCSNISKTPMNKYASVILLRETKSYTIFTTEGGQQQDIERTQGGLTRYEPIDRVVMFKRKQVAPERRTGKALMRQYGVFPHAMEIKEKKLLKIVYGEDAVKKLQEEAKNKDKIKVESTEDCYLTAGLCGHCIDCLTYGYAAIEGEGSRKSRVMTDSCYSVRPYALIQKGMKFNVIDEKEQTSGTITEYDYTTPAVFFPSVVTTVDTTLEEFVYILINLMRTTRYGKESSRQGFMRNHILAVTFSDMEIFSNLEFSQGFYDSFYADQEIDLAKNFLSSEHFIKHAYQVIHNLTNNLNGRLRVITNPNLITPFQEQKPDYWQDGLEEILNEVRNLSKDENALMDFLKTLNDQAVNFAFGMK